MGSVRGSRDPVVSALHRGVCGNRSDSGCDGARRTTRESSATIAFRPSDDGTASHARTWRRAGVADSATAAAGAEAQYGGGRGDRRNLGPGPLGIRAGRADQPPSLGRGYPGRSRSEPAHVGRALGTQCRRGLGSIADRAGPRYGRRGNSVAPGWRPPCKRRSTSLGYRRHAFGFLLGPANTKTEVPANPPAPKGA